MTQPSPAALWTGRVLTGLFALFMLGASYLALFVWGGLGLRDMRVRAVLPILR